MHPDVRKLLEVQKVDQRVAGIRRDIEKLPLERERRQAEVAAVRAERERRRNELQQAEVAQRTNELSIQQADQELEKLQVRLNTVRNNAEYQATLLQIESVKKERGRIEEEGLQLLERIEGARGELDAIEARLAEEQKVFDEFAAECEKLLAERQAQFAAASVGRDEMLEGVPVDLRRTYERLFAARDGQALAAVENGFCLGCYTSIPPNLQVRLQSGSSVVQCGSCQRILYLPES